MFSQIRALTGIGHKSSIDDLARNIHQLSSYKNLAFNTVKIDKILSDKLESMVLLIKAVVSNS